MIANHKLFIVLGGIPGTLNSGVREGLVRGPFIKRNRSLFHCYTPVNKHSNGKPPFSIGVTSSKGGFPIAMLVYRSVVGGGYPQYSPHQNHIFTNTTCFFSLFLSTGGLPTQLDRSREIFGILASKQTMGVQRTWERNDISYTPLKTNMSPKKGLF